MERLAEAYLACDPPVELYAFLKSRFRALQARHGGVVGKQVPIPKLLPLPDSKKSA
jgi:hypothetical protein